MAGSIFTNAKEFTAKVRGIDRRTCFSSPSKSCRPPTDLGEVAIYSEFGFEGAIIANNTVDGAALGIVTCNFNEGGRLAVVQGNLIRNLKPKRPAGTAPDDAGGVGIAIEADASVTGNVIENAPVAAIMVGWGAYMRDVSVTGNVVRNSPLGVAVSVVNGAGTAVITGNLISGALARRDRRHGSRQSGDRRSEPGADPLRQPADQRQPGAVKHWLAQDSWLLSGAFPRRHLALSGRLAHNP